MRDVALDIKVLSNLIHRELEQRSRLMAGDTVSDINGLIMSHMLSRGGIVFQKELEDAFGLTRSTISKVVNLMERKGMVEKIPAEHDARQRVIMLTGMAYKMAEQLQDESSMVTSQLLSDFDEHEIDVLSGFVARMMQNMRKEEA